MWTTKRIKDIRGEFGENTLYRILREVRKKDKLSSILGWS